jgi:hypothetical protein
LANNPNSILVRIHYPVNDFKSRVRSSGRAVFNVDRVEGETAKATVNRGGKVYSTASQIIREERNTGVHYLASVVTPISERGAHAVFDDDLKYHNRYTGSGQTVSAVLRRHGSNPEAEDETYIDIQGVGRWADDEALEDLDLAIEEERRQLQIPAVKYTDVCFRSASTDAIAGHARQRGANLDDFDEVYNTWSEALLSGTSSPEDRQEEDRRVDEIALAGRAGFEKQGWPNFPGCTR